MKKIESSGKIADKIVLILNVVIVVIIVTVLFTYFRTETENRTMRNREQFEAVAESVSQTIFGRLEAHQQMVDSAAGYINSKDMTIEEAIEYAESLGIGNEHMFHIVWTDTLTGLSTKGGKLEPDNYEVDYSNITSSRVEASTMINAMDILYDETPDITIHATRSYYNPTNAENTVAFYNKVTLDRDGERCEALIMLLAGVDDLRSEYSFPKGIFADTKTAIIDRDTGNYVIATPELKNTSFYEYIMQYNDIDYRDIEELKEKIANNQTVSETYCDYKNEETRFIISNVDGSENWVLITFLPVATLQMLSDDNLWSVTLTIVLLIALLLVFDLLFFISFTNALSRSVESERKAKEEAKLANRSKSDFLSTMSHDIRTPLNAIIGLTTLTKERVDDAELVSNNLRKIEQSGQHLLTLINDVLDISKIESGKLNFNVNPFSLDEVEEYLNDLCMHSAREKGLNLEIKVDTASEKRLLGDKLRVYQVLINILTNAIKYTKAGGFVNAHLTETLEGDNARLTYVVSDTGIGMSPEFMEHMYEAFARARDGRIDKVQGTGLGLAICKKIVEEMNGDIKCQSIENEGTTFTVTFVLPLVQNDTQNNNNNTVRDSLKELNILVAEDNDLNWEIISEMLDIKGHSAVRAENGQEAVRMLEEAVGDRKYDLVLMDIQMPVMNGLEAARAIRAEESEYLKQIPIIALTADAFTENIEEAIKAGMDSHVAKPVNIDILMHEISKVFAKKGYVK